MRAGARRAAAIAVAMALVIRLPYAARADDGPPAATAAPATSASSAPIASASSAPTAKPPTGPKIADPSGTPVRITSSNVDTDIYLAHGDMPETPVIDPFERIGRAPLEIRLAPGLYTIQSSTPTSSMGHARFHVEAGHPIAIEVRNGDAAVRTVGGVFEGLGITAMILGILAIVSISPHDDHYNRFGIALPLLLGGAGVTGIGVGMTFAGSTNIKIPTSSAQARMFGVTFSF